MKHIFCLLLLLFSNRIHSYDNSNLIFIYMDFHFFDVETEKDVEGVTCYIQVTYENEHCKSYTHRMYLRKLAKCEKEIETADDSTRLFLEKRIANLEWQLSEYLAHYERFTQPFNDTIIVNGKHRIDFEQFTSHYKVIAIHPQYETYIQTDTFYCGVEAHIVASLKRKE